jgi:hypothetical protein
MGDKISSFIETIMEVHVIEKKHNMNLKLKY